MALSLELVDALKRCLRAQGMTYRDLAARLKLSEAAVKRAMVASAREAFVLTDSSKLGVDHLVQFASLEDVDALVTDSGLPEASVAELRAAGMRVEVALFQHKTT